MTAWGSSWLSSWGGSWGEIEGEEPPPTPTPTPTSSIPSATPYPAVVDEWGSWKWPKGVCPQSATLLPQSFTLGQESPITRKRRFVQMVGDRWTYDLSFSFRRDRVASQRLEALLARLKGPVGKVAIWDFERPRPLGPAADWSYLPRTRFDDDTNFTDGTWFGPGTAGYRVYGDWDQGEEEIRIVGFPQNTTQLVGGDQIGLGGRLYRLSRDATSNGLGIARVYLHRGLLSDLSNGTTVVTTRPTSPFQLVDDDQAARSRNAMGLPTINLRFIEAL
jgi:hypothetical protein